MSIEFKCHMLTAERIKQCLLSQHPRGPVPPVDTQSIRIRIEAEERDTRIQMTFIPVSRTFHSLSVSADWSM